MSEHAGENCGKLCSSYILSSKRGITPSKIDAKGRHPNLFCRTSKQSHVQNFSSYVKACRRKVRKTVYFLYSKFTKRGNSFTNWRKVMTFKLKVMCKIAAQYVKACRRKVRKTVYFLYSKFTKRGNFFKNWRKVMTFKLDL